MYQIFDPKDLKDEELLERQIKLGQFIMKYRGTGHMHLVESMEKTLAVIEEELEYRVEARKAENKKEREERQNKRYTRKTKSKSKKKNTDVITIGHIKGVDD